jgi:hypothetical protein
MVYRGYPSDEEVDTKIEEGVRSKQAPRECRANQEGKNIPRNALARKRRTVHDGVHGCRPSAPGWNRVA